MDFIFYKRKGKLVNLSEKNIKIWLEIAEEDLDTAICCFNNKKLMWSVVMCQQAIEKILKALYVKNTGQIPEKTHNLIKLVQNVEITNNLDEETIILFNKLILYYLGSRYPDKRAKLQAECNYGFVEDIINKTKEVFKWVKEKL